MAHFNPTKSTQDIQPHFQNKLWNFECDTVLPWTTYCSFKVWQSQTKAPEINTLKANYCSEWIVFVCFFTHSLCSLHRTKKPAWLLFQWGAQLQHFIVHKCLSEKWNKTYAQFKEHITQLFFLKENKNNLSPLWLSAWWLLSILVGQRNIKFK